MIDALLEQVPGDPIDLNDGVWTLCTTHDELFREPSVPLSESLSAGGLAHQGDWVARSGFDFSAWHAQRRIDSIRSRYQLSEDEALAVLAALRLYNQVREVMDFVMDAAEDGDLSETASRMEQLPWMADPADDNSRPGPQQSTREHRTVGMILEFLAEPAVADAVRIETVSADRRAAEALGLFAESVESMAPRPARPALRWLRAVAQERLGEVEQAETTFNAADAGLAGPVRKRPRRRRAWPGASPPGRDAAGPCTGPAARALPVDPPLGSRPQPALLVRIGAQVQGLPPASRTAAAGGAGRVAVPEGGRTPVRGFGLRAVDESR